MGSGRVDRSTLTAYSINTAFRDDGTRKSINEVFTSRAIFKDFDPKNIKVRESCDSVDSPEACPIIIALDVTGSMGMIADHMIGESLAELMGGILDTQPVKDPHIMFMAVGDVVYDEAPLQATQFEADIRIAQQLTQIYNEGHGGGNNVESYNLPWYFAATRTKIDSFDKRGKKGYLFTIGDELPPDGLTADQINRVFGPGEQHSYTSKELLKMAEGMYNTFHILVEEGNYARRALASTRTAWRNLMSDHVIYLKNYKHIAEAILAVMRVNEGEDPETVIASFQDESVKDSVRHALFGAQ